MLEMAGLGEVAERAYRLLVRAAEAGAGELAGELGVGRDAVDQALATMVDMGLVREVGDASGRRYTPVAPDVSLRPWLARQQEAIDRARLLVDQLAEEHRANLQRRDADRMIEVVVGRAAIRERMRHVQDNARDEVVSFCRAGHVAMPSEENTEEMDALGRGVRYRVIYERELLEEPGMVPNVAYGIERGELARSAPYLPVRMAIADRGVAVLPLVQHVSGMTEPTAAVVRGGTLLEALIALFEGQWERATPIRIAGEGLVPASVPSCPLDADELYLLSLLVAGVADKSIASQLGLSQRTVQRRINHLMRLAGAQTRMQLAWHAAREHWL
ncbi:TrmB family transcriptional regulator [Spongiactinospora rosea]|uniref:TrmB family transcriptional regulator n=1 Tax=Spongiactinospora rosea TaxID=2248750 RepID=A0A366M0U5_9ACTN|nr:helix-turn-helix domain-containing protein [Spongiactinospora rosea]RBQ19848.1 TrmB family transcriptional regulator [Spongiactinospora rosea]